MNPESLSEQLDAPVRRFEYDDGETVLVADFGVRDDAVTIDVLDDTVILVVETGDEPVQHELDVPTGEIAKALINNGVVTVEVDQ
jgi:hypothetical protein